MDRYSKTYPGFTGSSYVLYTHSSLYVALAAPVRSARGALEGQMQLIICRYACSRTILGVLAVQLFSLPGNESYFAP